MFPIDAFQRTLGKATGIFRHLRIRFHLTGAVAAVYYAEPRLTQDIDIVIDNPQTLAVLDRFLESLEASDFLFVPRRYAAPSPAGECSNCSTARSHSSWTSIQES